MPCAPNSEFTMANYVRKVSTVDVVGGGRGDIAAIREIRDDCSIHEKAI